MDAHWPFVIAAYAAAFVIVAAMIVAVASDYVSLTRRLERLDRRAIVRRNDPEA